MTRFNKKMIFHTHVEKAAGTTLVQGLQTGLGFKHVHDLRLPQTKRPQQMTAAEKVQVWVLTGHFHYGAHMQEFARPKVFIASVRHPFDRFRSYVNYVRSGHPAFKYIGGKTFAQVIEEYLGEKRPQADNQMSRVLTGSSEPTLDMVIENIEGNYLFVAPHRRVNEGLALVLETAAGEAAPERLHSNKGPKKEHEEVGEWEERFNRANEIDIALHRYVEDNFDRWMTTSDQRWDLTAKLRPPSS